MPPNSRLRLTRLLDSRPCNFDTGSLIRQLKRGLPMTAFDDLQGAMATGRDIGQRGQYRGSDAQSPRI